MHISYSLLLHPGVGEHREGKEPHEQLDLRQGTDEWSCQSSSRMLQCSGSEHVEAVPKQSFLCMEDQIQPRLRRGEREHLGSAGPTDRLQHCLLASWRERAGGSRRTWSIRIV